MRESQSDPNNLTMCPILDFANHAEKNSHIFPVIKKNQLRKPGERCNANDYTFISSANGTIDKDQQLFLRYGGHSNRTLFVEYGFVNAFSPDDITTGAFHGEVDVQDLIEKMFSASVAGVWLRTELEHEGYWGYYHIEHIHIDPLMSNYIANHSDWTLDSAPSPAHPSYRLITALRLYHLAEVLPDKSRPVPDEIIRPWKDVLQGQRDIISAQNENLWRTSLLNLCESVRQRAEVGMRDTTSAFSDREGPEWVEWMKGNILALWREELDIATAVMCSIDAGEEF